MDLYIENKETQKYGPEAQRNITVAFAKSPAPVRTFIGFLVGKQAEADQTMATAVHEATGAESERSAQAGFKKDPTVPDAKKLTSRLVEAEKTLDAEIKKAHGAATSAKGVLSERSAEKRAWLACYRGIAHIVEGLLTMEGRAEELAAVVPHLSVPGGKRERQAAAAGKPAEKTGGTA